MWKMLGWYMASRLKSPNFNLDTSLHTWDNFYPILIESPLKINEMWSKDAVVACHIQVLKNLDTNEIRYFKWNGDLRKYTKMHVEEIIFCGI